MMRNLLFFGLLVGGAFMAGWFTINRDGDRTTIEINRSEIRSDARQVIDRGRNYLDQREQQRLPETQWASQQPAEQGSPYAPQHQLRDWSPQAPAQPYPDYRYAEQYPAGAQGAIQTQGYWVPQVVPSNQAQQARSYDPNQQPYAPPPQYSR